ncbi:MAG: hypothetical protein V1712_02950 [Patescibacteria group bacterium]
MEKEQKTKRRPFHETIIDAIRNASSLKSNDPLMCLAKLIKETEIPKGHDEIIAAWNQRLPELWSGEDFGVPADLLEQKQEAAEKEKAKEQVGITSSFPLHS